MLSLVHSNEYHGGQITVILSSFGGDFYWIDQIDQSFKDRLTPSSAAKFALPRKTYISDSDLYLCVETHKFM